MCLPGACRDKKGNVRSREAIANCQVHSGNQTGVLHKSSYSF